jgi:hypothetical protein
MKWHGKIGFETQVEVSLGPGKATIWRPDIVERHYYGDVQRLVKRYDTGDKVNNDISINNQFSIISDPFASNNFFNMKWIEWMGRKWEVKEVTVEPPRLTINIGGEYKDGNNARTPERT